MKLIKINTPNGQYTLPLKDVAEHRANYYTGKSNPLWEKEINFIMNDDYEGIDWLLNSSDWEDWEGKSTKINNDVKVTDEDFWCDSEDFEII